MFFVDEIRTRYMNAINLSNHVVQTYKNQAGGGAIGALTAWGLQSRLGTVIAALILFTLFVLLLMGTGIPARILRKVRANRDELFDGYDDFERPDAVHILEKDEPVRRQKRSVPKEVPSPEPVRRRRNAAPETSREAEPVRRSGRSALQDDAYESASQRSTRFGPVPRTESEYISEETEAPKRSPRRNQLYTEPAPSRSKRREVDDGSLPVRKPRTSAEPKAPVREYDDSNAEEANRTRRDAETPNRPSRAAYEAPAQPAAARSSRVAYEDEPMPVRKGHSGRAEYDIDPDELFEVEDDLTIEPEHADVLEGDFTQPKAEKKPLGKLKRPTKQAEEKENEYNYPPIDLLDEGEAIEQNYRADDEMKAQKLMQTLREFGINSTLTGIAHGPAVTRFEVLPDAGIKVSRITTLSDDIAMRLAAMSVRIEAPIPGKSAVGVEIPNSKVETVRLRDVLESDAALGSASKLAVGLGKDNSGRYIVADIAKMPHVLIAGQTGSGKSVCINSIITSILFRATPEEVKLILIDPKVVELSIYNGIPHLVCPVVTDCKKAAGALQWAVSEMERRYKVFADAGVRDIKGYNKELPEGEKPMPKMVIIIDELADLMMVAQGDVEDSICRLAQLARAAGMHLVIATQRPSVNVITGTIKANIPTRIAFSVASQIDSRTMIDHGGAEKLLGNGDMLFVPSGINKPMRVQGAWVSDDEVHKITSYIKANSEAEYDADMIERIEKATMTDAEKEDFNSEYDDRLPEAVEIVVEAGQASVSMLQRRMRVGYARAGRLIDEMEQRGIVSEADGSKPRTVLITREQMNDLFEN